MFVDWIPRLRIPEATFCTAGAATAVKNRIADVAGITGFIGAAGTPGAAGKFKDTSGQSEVQISLDRINSP